MERKFNIVVEPGCGYLLDELKDLDVTLLPYEVTFGGEHLTLMDSSWERLSEKDMYEYFKEGKITAFARTVVGVWKDLIEPLLTKDVLYVSHSQKVCNCMASVKFIGSVLGKEGLVHVADSKLLYDRFLLEEVIRLRDEGKTAEEAIDFINSNHIFYRNVFLPKNLNVFKFTRRGDPSGEIGGVYNAIYSDEEGCFKVYPKSFKDRREALCYILDSFKPKEIIYSYSYDVEEGLVDYFEEACKERNILVRKVPSTPLVLAAIGSNSLYFTVKI